MMKLMINNLTNTEQMLNLQQILERLNIPYDKEMNLGELVFPTLVSKEKIALLKTELDRLGLEILYERKQVLAAQVKHLVKEMLALPEAPQENYSRYISNRLKLNYTYLANIFSESQGITIEHFTINQKIDMAKKLLLEGNYSIGEIAELLHYSSIGHLSNQFKKVTGVNPTEFKRLSKATQA